MNRPARWMCKTCKTFGYGGPDTYNIHAKQHEDYRTRNAQVTFGFAPNYSNGSRSRYDWGVSPVRLEDGRS